MFDHFQFHISPYLQDSCAVACCVQNSTYAVPNFLALAISGFCQQRILPILRRILKNFKNFILPHLSIHHKVLKIVEKFYFPRATKYGISSSYAVRSMIFFEIKTSRRKLHSPLFFRSLHVHRSKKVSHYYSKKR